MLYHILCTHIPLVLSAICPSIPLAAKPYNAEYLPWEYEAVIKQKGENMEVGI